MDLVIDKAALSGALFFGQSVVERRTTMPILANLLISAADGTLRISASDLEITTVSSAPAKVKSAGSTTVNARVFSDIVKELPDGEVQLKLTDGERLEIIARSSRWKMVGVSAEEYPSLPGISIEAKSAVPAHQLLEMINKTAYAISLDEARYNLNGVCFEHIKEGKGKKAGALRLVATDGHRLAMVTRPVAGLQFEGSIIVPRKGLTEMRKMLDSQGERDVRIEVSEGFFIVESDEVKMSIRLIDGTFPDYQQVLPKTPGTQATVNANELTQALRRVALMVTDKGKCVKLDFAKGQLRVSSSSPELGEASEELPVQYEGKPLSVGFNARYLLDFTASLTEEQPVVMELNGELGPGKLSPEGDESYVAIVMPMRLG